MSVKFRNISIGLLALFFILAFINLNIGFTDLNFTDFFSSDESTSLIAQLRINRVIIIFLAGISIPTSGFLMQEYFQNPLAGPEVLGITSVASLAVASYIFLTKDFTLPEFLQSGLISMAAFAGSLLLMLILLAYSKAFTDKTYLIIFGFLISALASAIVSLMQVYAQSESLKSYVLWSFGANNQVTLSQIAIVGVLVTVGMFLCFRSIKPLMGNALGESYAKSFGVNLERLKYLVIICSSLLSASITAFLGPVLFIGIVVPHFCRMLWNPAQLWQQWILNILFGACLLELFSIISELAHWPINIISSLFGVPVILTMLVKMNRRAV
ncbi:ABC transporter permease [Elizabethkingia sp. HvH-WGS333]|uniref:FecCD family ABC transporter permease n=1 Tax=Elizabethkingia TaxID=308865 RepID=UPI0007415E9B|nr:MULTISPECIES: iron ABC transporter permease [Elizabethkingia]KUG13895.1 ABC transporter permease [Elizabethkingia miricola]MCL1658456.1 iron ABC transporter permease [Elizabethkingia miricola]MCP1253870.1 iron ABC transporter permease [Elizabethkingia sp. S0634]OIK45285.1 ABC transporter permease [Elizabethkingia sp. HvH-WGS333]